MPTDFATRGARAEHLLSKLIAGGLSAGVVLLWWPHFFPHDSAGTWVARGISWTLLTEILVVAVSPIEHVLRARVASLAPVGQLRSFMTRSSRVRAWLALALAATAVSAPLMLIATGHPAKAEAPKREVTNVTRVVKVVKRVQVRKIVVREAAPAAPASIPTPAPTATTRVVTPAAPKRAATKKAPAKRRTQEPKPSAETKPVATPTPAATTAPATPTPASGA
jgi:hypothetical protein